MASTLFESAERARLGQSKASEVYTGQNGSPTATPSLPVEKGASLFDAAEQARTSMVPEVAPTTEAPPEFKAPGFFSKHILPGIKATPEVAAEGVIGIGGFLLGKPSKMAYMFTQGLLRGPTIGPEDLSNETIAERGEFVEASVHDALRKLLYLGMETDEPSDLATESLEYAFKPFELLNKVFLDEPREVLRRIDKVGGEITADALELFTYFVVLPKFTHAAKGMRHRGKTIVRTPTGKTTRLGKREVVDTPIERGMFEAAMEKAERSTEMAKRQRSLWENRIINEKARHGIAMMEEAAWREQGGVSGRSREAGLQKYYDEVFGGPELMRQRGAKLESNLLNEIWKEIEKRPGKRINSRTMRKMIRDAHERLGGELLAKDAEFARWFKERERADAAGRLADRDIAPPEVDPLFRPPSRVRSAGDRMLIEARPELADTSPVITSRVYEERAKAMRSFTQRLADVERGATLRNKPRGARASEWDWRTKERSSLNDLTKEPPEPGKTPVQTLEDLRGATSIELLRELVNKEKARDKYTRDQLEGLAETERFLSEGRGDFAPTPDTIFESAIKTKKPRGMRDILEDLQELFGGEGGMASARPLSPEKLAARDRLLKDLEVIKRNAHNTGKSIEQYLVDAGVATPDVAAAVAEAAKQMKVLRNPTPRLKQEVENLGKQNPEKKPNYRNLSDAEARAEMKEATSALKKMQLHAWQKAKKSWRQIFDMFGIVGWTRHPTIRRALRNAEDPQAWIAFSDLILASGYRGRATPYWESFRQNVIDPLPRKVRDALDLHLRLVRTHVIDEAYAQQGRKKPYKRPAEVTKEAARKAAEDPEAFGLQEGLSPGQVRQMLTAEQALFDLFQDLLAKKLEAGLISATDYQNMQPYRYIPTKYLFEHFDVLREALTVRDPVKGMTVERGEVFELKGGKIGEVIYEMNIEKLAHDSIMQTEFLIDRNRANRSLLKLARNKLSKDIVRPSRTKKNGKPIPPEPGYVQIAAMEKGRPVYMDMAADMAKQWNIAPRTVHPWIAACLRWGTLAPVTKFFATGPGQPLFWWVNLPQDTMLAASTAMIKDLKGKYRPLFNRWSASVSTARIIRRHGQAAGDVWNKKGIYKDLVEQGVMMEFMAKQGESFGKRYKKGKTRQHADQLQEVLNSLNVKSEILVRAAVFKEALTQLTKQFKEINGREPSAMEMADLKRRSAFVAKDYLNFSDSGILIKFVDGGVPYTNAMFQVTRGLFRLMRHDPKGAIVKAVEIATLAWIYDEFMNRNHAQERKETSEYDRNNFLVQYLPSLGIKDQKGNLRIPYLKIMPKEQSQIFISTAVEMANAARRGDKVEWDRLREVLLQNSPVGTSNLPPLLTAILGYSTNTDLLTGQELWRRGPMKDEKEAFNNYTNQLWKDLASIPGLNANPTKLEYSIKSVVTRNNPLVSLFETGYDRIFQEVDTGSRESLGRELLLNKSFGKIVGLTHPIHATSKRVEEVESEANQRIWVRNREVDRLATLNTKGEMSNSEARNKMRVIADGDANDLKSMLSRFRDFKKFEGIENRSRILDIKYAPDTKAKAELALDYVNDYGRDAEYQLRRLGILNVSLRREMSRLQKESREQ